MWKFIQNSNGNILLPPKCFPIYLNMLLRKPVTTLQWYCCSNKLTIQQCIYHTMIFFSLWKISHLLNLYIYNTGRCKRRCMEKSYPRVRTEVSLGGILCRWSRWFFILYQDLLCAGRLSEREQPSHKDTWCRAWGGSHWWTATKTGRVCAKCVLITRLRNRRTSKHEITQAGDWGGTKRWGGHVQHSGTPPVFSASVGGGEVINEGID